MFLHSLGPSCIRNRSTTAETKKSGLAVSIFRGRWAGPLQRLQFALPPLLTGSGVGSLNAHFAVPWGVQDLLYEMSATRKPGGCADLLCLSLMLFFLEEKGGPGVDKKEIAIDNGIW